MPPGEIACGDVITVAGAAFPVYPRFVRVKWVESGIPETV